MRPLFRIIAPAILVGAAVLSSCRESEPEPEAAAPDTTPARPVVDVTAVDYAFQAPDEIPSGWATFRMHNEGAEPHFLLLTRMPAGKTIEDYGQDVGAVFDEVWKELRSGAIGKQEAGEKLGRLLPEWYLTSATAMGGPGLLAPGGTGETTVNLEPGYYIMECYVKTAEGEFHAALGMVRPLIVTDSPSGEAAPEADTRVTLTNDAIDAPSTMTPGRHTIAVHFTEHLPYGLGNDVHLARLDGISADTLARWMDWMDERGLAAPAPAPFLGGAEEGPAGTTAYFTVEVDPGRYAWVTETDPARGMVQEVVVE